MSDRLRSRRAGKIALLREKYLLLRFLSGVVLSSLLFAVAQLAGAQNAMPVKVAKLEHVAVYHWKSAPATVVSMNNTSIATQIKARVDEITVKVGEIVEPGSVLVRLDCTDYRIAVQRVEADIAALQARIELAERRLERTRKLERQQSVSAELLDQREADLSVLRAEHQGAMAALENAQIGVSRCIVRSPYRAVVTERVAAVGEFADVGARLLEIIDIEALEISAQVPALDVVEVEQAGEMYFEDAAQRYAISLRAVTPAINTRTRNREVRFLFSAESALPGAAGKLIWRDVQPHVSSRMLVRRGNDFGVFINDDGAARFHVIAEAQQGRSAPLDLPLDTVVITEGQYRLEDGQPVILYNPR